ncbi:MAG: EthD family reductase [Calditrichaeota bacterium]|nr:EthD family reductase [Calditrichota bacterium]
MINFIAFYKHPENVEAFDKAYWETHIPLINKVPGLAGLQAHKFWPGKDGPAPYYMMAVLSFADKESFKAGMKSPEMAEAGANLMSFAKGLVEFQTTELDPRA